MSHFCVMVLCDVDKTVDELLAPYQENNMGDVPEEYLEFHDAAKEEREDYETGTKEFVMYEGRLYSPYDDVFKKPDASPYGFCSSNYEVPEGLPRVNIPFTTLYPTIEDYLRDWCGYEETDPKTGRYGYWENPNAKWDWYEEGGRWASYAVDVLGCDYELVTEDYGSVIGKVTSKVTKGISVGDALDNFAKVRDSVMEDAAKRYDENHGDSMFSAFDSYGMDRERFVEREGHIHAWAVVTPDGKWHEDTEMYAFGMSDKTDDSDYEWCVNFEKRFLTDRDLTLHVIDCHI